MVGLLVKDGVLFPLEVDERKRNIKDTIDNISVITEEQPKQVAFSIGCGITKTDYYEDSLGFYSTEKTVGINS